MAKRQKKPQPVVIPDLALITMSDLMSLLLVFFVLLFSLSEIRKDKVVKAVRALRNQLGIMPQQKSPVLSFTPSQRMSQTQAYILRQGPPGKNPEVMMEVTQQRMKYIIGGNETFAPGSAVLLPTAQSRIRSLVAPELRGYQNRIEIVGHATADEGGDPWMLAGERARAVMRFFVDDCQIDEKRFRLVNSGANEPRDPAAAPSVNRRVEVVMTEYLARSN